MAQQKSGGAPPADDTDEAKAQQEAQEAAERKAKAQREAERAQAPALQPADIGSVVAQALIAERTMRMQPATATVGLDTAARPGGVSYLRGQVVDAFGNVRDDATDEERDEAQRLFSQQRRSTPRRNTEADAFETEPVESVRQ